MIIDYLSAIETQWLMNSPILMNHRETEVCNRICNSIRIFAETYHGYSRPYSVHNASIGLGIGLGN